MYSNGMDQLFKTREYFGDMNVSKIAKAGIMMT